MSSLTNGLITGIFQPTVFTRTDMFVQERDEPIQIQNLQRGQAGEGGLVTIATVSDLEKILKFSQIVLLSPEPNPNASAENEIDLEKLHAAIRDDLDQMGFKYTPVNGFYRKLEKSYIVHLPNRQHSVITQSIDHPDLKDLVELGRNYHQESILYCSWGRQFYYHTCGIHKECVQYGEGFRFFDSKPSDLYSEIILEDGSQAIFQLEIDFGYMYLGIEELANRFEQISHHRYSEFFVIRGGEPSQLNALPAVTPTKGRKILYLTRGTTLTNQFAEELKSLLLKKGDRSVIAISTNAHLAQINREYASKQLSWEEIRDEKTRRNKEAVCIAMANHYSDIIFASIGKCLSFLEPFVELAERYGYEVCIVRCGINDPAQHPYTARHLEQFQFKEKDQLLIGRKIFSQYKDMTAKEVLDLQLQK